jgi:hypothetical protein
MPIQLNEENGGKTLVAYVSGKLTKADYQRFVPELERLVLQQGKLRVLFDMTGFHGWEAGALWEDIKFEIKHSGDLERLAMVEKRSGSMAWRRSASRSRTRRSDTSITPKLLRRGNGWAKLGGFVTITYVETGSHRTVQPDREGQYAFHSSVLGATNGGRRSRLPTPSGNR